MSRNAATTAISNNSWGHGDYGQPDPATELWEAAVKHGVTTGYDGKGVFYAWAAGNGGDRDDYSTLDELANFYAVTAVCAVGHDDIRSEYSEAGANLWVCGPSSSGRDGQPRIATTDNGHRYRGSFGGTSAATPIVRGCGSADSRSQQRVDVAGTSSSSWRPPPARTTRITPAGSKALSSTGRARTATTSTTSTASAWWTPRQPRTWLRAGPTSAT